jgi:Tfp pilus assembly protein PilP
MPKKPAPPAKGQAPAPAKADAKAQAGAPAKAQATPPAKTPAGMAAKTQTAAPPAKAQAAPRAKAATSTSANPKPAAAPAKAAAGTPAKRIAGAPAKAAAKPAEGPKETAKTASATPPKPPAEKAPEEKPVVRRDPFDTLLTKARAGNAPPENLPPGKAGLIVDTLRIDGIVHSPNGMIAIVSNAQQRVYFLREGDKLYDGSVDKIALDAISFHETGKDAFGKPLERLVTKRLYPSPGEQQ